MLGYNESKDEVFCDLRCDTCGGLRMQTCPMTGNIGNMLLAKSRCLGLGIKFLDSYKPTGFWGREFCLDRNTLPTVGEFPHYRNEKPN